MKILLSKNCFVFLKIIFFFYVSHWFFLLFVSFIICIYFTYILIATTRLVYERKLSRLLRNEHFDNLDEEAVSPVGESPGAKPSAKLSAGVLYGESSRAVFETGQRQSPAKETFVEASTKSVTDPPVSQRRPFMYE